jgi:hypothetical protein
MSELRAYKADVTIPVYGTIADAQVYLKSETDKVIAEKDMALEYAKALILKDIETIKEKDKEIAELKEQLESEKASRYAESVDAGMRERRLKRELWLARANRSLEKIAWFKLWNASISTMNPEDGARQEFDKWKKALGKFLSKAEEDK